MSMITPWRAFTGSRTSRHEHHYREDRVGHLDRRRPALVPGSSEVERRALAGLAATAKATVCRNSRPGTTQCEWSCRQPHARCLQQFLDAIPIGVVVATPDGRPSYANREAERLLGKRLIVADGSSRSAARHENLEHAGERRNADPELLGPEADGILLAQNALP